MTDDDLDAKMAELGTELGLDLSGDADAPPRSVMNSRRLMGLPLRPGNTPYHIAD
jgi:hypothetical protein